MTFDPDDPRLTAYALGELEGTERAAIESLLAESPDARRVLDETRTLAELLTARFRAEPSPGLAPAQKAAIETELSRTDTPPAVPFRPLSSRLLRYSLAATVLLALGAGTLAFLTQDRSAAWKTAPVLTQSKTSREPEATIALDSAPVAERAGAVSAARSERLNEAERLTHKPSGASRATDALGAANLIYRDVKPGKQATRPGSANAARSPAAPASDPQPGGNSGMPGMGMMAEGSAYAMLPAESAARSRGVAPDYRGGANQQRESALGRLDALRYETPSSAAPKPRAGDRKPQSESAQRFAGGSMGGFAGGQLAQAGRQPGSQDHAALGDKRGESVQSVPQLQITATEGGDLQAQKRQAQPQQGAGQPGQGQQGQSSQGQANKAGQSQPAQDQPFAQNQKKLDTLALGLEARPMALAETEELAKAAEPAPEAPPTAPAPVEARPIGGERFTPIVENLFEPVTPENTLSTFSTDVDTASYANVRRYLSQNLWPPADAVRIEEMVNYFDYDYAPPSPSFDVPFAVHTEVVRCPWNPENHLLRVALKGKEIDFADRKPSNLVFLVDVSGSMDQPNKLPLVKAGLRMLVEQLGENDKIALVVYAGSSGLALPATRGDQKERILEAIDRLTPGGSTHGSAGLVLAYQIAVENFVDGGINRVILATDGDFNVGVTGPDAVSALAAEKAKTGVFLNVLGVGDGNLKDETMEKIADRGNGSYNYLDTLLEARKVLVEQVGGTLQTIAKDVKVQVEFNPARVAAFRLIGYENRLLADADFADDTKDAGEIGSGHTVTALYELVPTATGEPAAPPEPLADADAPAPAAGLRYVKPAEVKEDAATSKELLTVHLRYKAPEGHKSTPIDHPVADEAKDLGHASADTKFAASVAEFGMLLRGSRFVGQGSLDAVLELARANLGPDPSGRRHEFVGLVEKAKALRGQ